MRTYKILTFISIILLVVSACSMKVGETNKNALATSDGNVKDLKIQYIKSGAQEAQVSVTSMVKQPGDGKLLVGGSISYLAAVSRGTSEIGKTDAIIARFMPNGSLDKSFGKDGDGIVRLNVFDRSYITALALQSDGKILAAGGSNVTHSSGFVARFDQSGKLDAGFASNGIFKTIQASIASASFTRIIVETRTGIEGIYIAGNAFDTSSSNYEAIILKLDSGGTLVGPLAGGAVTVVTGSPNLDGLAIQSDGSMIISGRNTFAYETYIVRVKSNGTVDPSFGSAGLVLANWSIAASSFITDIALLPDESIIALGYDTGDNTCIVAKYLNSTGALDPSFGSSGIVKKQFGGSSCLLYTLFIPGDGNIFAVGTVKVGADSEALVVKLNASNGSLNTSFNATGYKTMGLSLAPVTDDIAFAIISSGSNIVLAGTSALAAPEQPKALLSMFAMNATTGATQASFGNSGKTSEVITTDFSFNKAYTVTSASNGKTIILGGFIGSTTYAHQGMLSAHNPDGSTFEDFGGDGYAIMDLGTYLSVGIKSMRTQPDNNILALLTAGSDVSIYPTMPYYLVRYNLSGSMDTNFASSTNNMLRIDEAPYNNLSSYSGGAAFALQADGKIIAAYTTSSGSSDTRFDFLPIMNSTPDIIVLKRYLSNGTDDTSFGNNGVTTISLTDLNLTVRAVSVQPSGKIVVAGSAMATSNTRFFATRLDPAGKGCDLSFGNNGFVIIDETGSNYTDMKSMAVRSDGYMVLAGYRYKTSSSSVSILTMISPDGLVDRSFGNSGIIERIIPSAQSNICNSVGVDKSGIIICVGYVDDGKDTYPLIFAYSKTESGWVADRSFGDSGVYILKDKGAAESIYVDKSRTYIAGWTYADNGELEFQLAAY